MSDRIQVAASKLLATSVWTTGSAALVHDLRRDELAMVEILQAEHLKIDPASTHICILATGIRVASAATLRV